MENNKQITPVSPDEIMDNLVDIIPSYIIESVNDFLKLRYRNTGGVKITVDELIDKIHTKKQISRNQLFDDKLLDFESLYRDNGWVVTFKKPDRDENFSQYYYFEKKN